MSSGSKRSVLPVSVDTIAQSGVEKESHSDVLQLPDANIFELLLRITAQFSEKEFLIYYDENGTRIALTYEAITNFVKRTANFLVASGISKGDKVATVSRNHWETVVQYFAVFAVGGIVVPINAGEDDKRIQYTFENSGVKLAFVHNQLVSRIKGIREKSSLNFTIVQSGVAEAPSDLPFLERIARFQATSPKRDSHSLSDEALIVYTSGTTGNPKGVVLTQYNLLVDAKAISDWHEITSEQTMMCVLPIHHVNGTVVTIITPLFVGASVVLNHKFQSDHFFPRIAAESVSIVSVVPTLLQFLLHADIDLRAYDLSSLRHIICGAGPLTIELAQNFERRYRIPIIHGYGLSETTCYSCFLPLSLTEKEHQRWMSDYGFPSIGAPLPVNTMEIHDELGVSQPVGMKGEIVIRGHNVMRGYFRNEEANASAFRSGWFRTGDEGFFHIDSRGRKFFFISGRLKELIIRGGVNISPLEIDEVLMQIAGVESGIAIGFENDWYGEEVGAYVKLKPGVKMEAEFILQQCRARLPFSKSPKAVVFGSDIPVTSTGKYQRNRCKVLFQDWKKVQFNEKR
jgi:long-chain acyl-CoA synthetase